MITALVLAVTVAVPAAMLAVYLARLWRDLERRELHRRLGVAASGEQEASLLRRDGAEDAAPLVATLLQESGLGWTVEQLAMRCAAAAGAGALAGAVLGGGVAAVALALLGAAAFPAKVLYARRQRLLKCDQQLPAALRLITLALRAGQALPGALALAAREAPQPLAAELKRAVEEHGLGRSMTSVIQRLAARLHLSESARAWSVAIRVLEQTGGNLIQVIDSIVESARARSQYEARLRALTAEGRTSALVLGLMPPSFFLVGGILDPTYWKTLLGDSAGPWALLLAVGLWGAGVGWTVQLVKSGSAR